MKNKNIIEEIAKSIGENPFDQDIIDGVDRNEITKDYPEKEKLILARDVERYRYARLFGEKVLDKSLRHKKKAIRFLPLLYYPFVELSKEQVNRGIKEKDFPLVRMAFVYKQNISFTQDQIDILIDDDLESIRLALMQREDVELTESQLDKVLSDKSLFVVLTALSKEGTLLTDIQIEDGIKKVQNLLEGDDTFNLRDILNKAFHVYSKHNKAPDSLDTNDELEAIRLELKKYSINYTSVLFKEDLKEKTGEKSDLKALLRYPFAKIDPNQTDYFLNNKDIDVRLAYLSRPNVKLTSEQVESILEDPDENEYVRLAVLNNEDTVLTPKQIDLLLVDDSRFRHAVVSKSGVSLTPKQVQNGLDDPNDDVRLAFGIYKKAYGIEAPVPSTNPTRIKKGV